MSIFGLRQIELSDGKGQLCQQLDVAPSSVGWCTAAISECIRLFVYGRVINSHTSAISAAIQRSLQPYVQAFGSCRDSQFAEIGDHLDAMAQSGDLYRASGGRWKACPTTLVPVPNSDDVLVVGGTPTVQLFEQFNYRPIGFGRARILAKAYVPKAVLDDASNCQTVVGWMGCSDSTTEDWAKSEIRRAELCLGHGTLEGAKDLSVYLPERQCVRQFRRRWVKITDAIEFCREPRLARARVSESIKFFQYFVIQVKDAKLRSPSFRSRQIERSTARRLMYGLDVQANNPIKAKWNASAEEAFTLELYRGWPEAESRILALGDRLPKMASEKRFRYLFSSRVGPLVKFGLDRLGLDCVLE